MVEIQYKIFLSELIFSLYAKINEKAVFVFKN